MLYDNIINEIKDNNFFENSDVREKLNFMLKSIKLIQKQSEQNRDKWKTLHDSFTSGYYNKAISKVCLNFSNDVLESANTAKNYLDMINNIFDKKKVDYYMYKYNEEIININKINSQIKDMSCNLLTEDKEILEINSDSEPE